MLSISWARESNLLVLLQVRPDSTSSRKFFEHGGVRSPNPELDPGYSELDSEYPRLVPSLKVSPQGTP